MTPEDMFNKLIAHIVFEHEKYGHVPVHQLEETAERLRAMEKELAVKPTPELTKQYNLLKQRYDMSRRGAGAANPRPGYNTSAVIQVVDHDGRIVALAFGDYDGAGHAEQHAIKELRRQLGATPVPGGRVEVVGDKVVCSKVCAPELRALATELQVSRVDSHVYQRESLRKDVGKPGRLASEKTTMRTLTKATSADRSLTRGSTTLYEREAPGTATGGSKGTAPLPTVPVGTESAPLPSEGPARSEPQPQTNERPAPGQRATVGTPDMEPVHEGGPDARGTADGDGITLGLQGLNFVLSILNARTQRRRLEEALAAKEPEIARIRRERPDCGVLVRIVFRHTDGQPDSPLQPGPVFERVELGVGRTQRDADKDVRSAPRLLPGIADNESEVTEATLWVPALKPVAAAPPRPPFPAFALATFASRTPKLQNVEWSSRWGFDDEDSAAITVPDGVAPRFYVLQMPSEMPGLGGGKHDPEVERQTLPLDVRSGIPVVKLDPDMPFFNVAAAALFPADEATAELFGTAPPTINYNDILVDDFDLVRWARPEQIKLVGP
jgi:hypothetical protein